MKSSSNKTKDSHNLSYLLRHDKTCKLETGGWRSVENLAHEQGFTFEQLCDFIDNDSKNSMMTKQRFGPCMGIPSRWR